MRRLPLLLLLFCTSSWGAAISSTFSSDDEGWLIADRSGFSLVDLGNAIGTRPTSYFGTGGNPGSFIYGVDGPAWWWWRAPAKFLGNQAGAYGGSLSFDLMSDLGIGDGYNVLVILESGGTRLIGTSSFFRTANTWTHFSIPLVAGSAWINFASQLPATAAELTAVLGNLTVMDINAEYGSGFDTGGLDNVALVANSANTAPVAQCQDLIVSADATCSASASVNNGSFDPDGNAITITQSPAGPYPLGTTPVTLTVTDSHGASSTCTATVTVVDTTPPIIGAFSVRPAVLSPRLVRLVPVQANVTSSDGPTRLPSGRIEPDWIIRNGQLLYLRAYRKTPGVPRLYT